MTGPKSADYDNIGLLSDSVKRTRKLNKFWSLKPIWHLTDNAIDYFYKNKSKYVPGISNGSPPGQINFDLSIEF